MIIKCPKFEFKTTDVRSKLIVAITIPDEFTVSCDGGCDHIEHNQVFVKIPAEWKPLFVAKGFVEVEAENGGEIFIVEPTPHKRKRCTQ